MVAEQLQARVLSWWLDPVAFALDCGFTPDPTQEDVLRRTGPRICVNTARQWGKSTVASILALLTCLLKPGALVLVGSVGERQGKELLRKTGMALSVLASKQLAPQVLQTSTLRLELGNRSRLVVLPGLEANCRGYSAPDLVIIDEAARCMDSFYYSGLSPMMAMAPQGRMVLLSTSWRERGFFWKIATSDDPSWERIQVKAEDCPRYDKAFLERERREMGELRYGREYQCAFGAATGRLFSDETIAKGKRSRSAVLELIA